MLCVLCMFTVNEDCGFVCCDMTVCVSILMPLFLGHAIVLWGYLKLWISIVYCHAIVANNCLLNLCPKWYMASIYIMCGEYFSNCNNLNVSSQGLGFLLYAWSFNKHGHIIYNSNIYWSIMPFKKNPIMQACFFMISASVFILVKDIHLVWYFTYQWAWFFYDAFSNVQINPFEIGFVVRFVANDFITWCTQCNPCLCQVLAI